MSYVPQPVWLHKVFCKASIVAGLMLAALVDTPPKELQPFKSCRTGGITWSRRQAGSGGQ
eukprot:4075960-Alexandrium_andersonii.AAC.1